MDITIADQDSDFGYTTNQPDIVEHARRCYQEYPTIVNNIPKSTKVYENTLEAFAEIDSSLAKSQLDIGESSNLAQIAQTYDCSFDDPRFKDYVCILSVIAQIAIDSAKRQFDIDVTAEIKRIKKEMDIKHNGYPEFWGIIKKGFNKSNINHSLHCPMDYLCHVNVSKYRSTDSTLPMSHFFVKHQMDIHKKTRKRIEDMIIQYSLKVYEAQSPEGHGDFLLMRSDFENLMASIRAVNISQKYVGLISWLLDRAFLITPDVSRNRQLKSRLSENQSTLMKVLYEVNPKAFLSCFVKNAQN